MIERRWATVRRLWGLSPAWHLLALAVVLLALVPVVGTSSSFLSDEGAAVIQGRALASGDGWIVDHPMPEVDPEGAHYPLVNSERGARGFAPLAKHPAYSLLVAAAQRVGGVPATVLLSIGGTIAAAGLAAALARRLDPVLSRPTVWAVGMASPLFFNGYLVMGHTLGAALAAAAVLCAVVAITDHRPGVALAVAPCVAAAVLIRSESMLFAGSLAVVTAALAVRSPRRREPLLVSASALLAALVARAAEAAWVAHIVGDGARAVSVPASPGAPGFLQGRLDGFVMTWLLPDYHASSPVTPLLLGVVLGLAVAAIAARTASGHSAKVLVPIAFAGACAVGAVVAAPRTVVPGLLIAFPLMTAGLLAMRRAHLGHAGAPILGTATLFALAVIATQYPSGGTGEWGGRYFALAVPVVVPVLLLAVHRQGQTLERVVRRGVLGGLVVCSAALATLSLMSIRASHQSSDRFIDSIERAMDVAGPGRPILTTWSAAPRFAWPVYDRSPWLLVRPHDVGTVRGSLSGHGVDRFVFVTVDVEADRTVLAGLDILSSEGPPDSRRRVLVVRESA